MDQLTRLNLKAGKILIKENSMTRKLFILKRGKVRVYKSYMGGRITLAILNPGEIFGELSFFDAKPRSASVVAHTDVVVECIDGDQLSGQISALPNWVHLIFNSVADRFRVMDQKMAMLESLNQFQRKTLSSGDIGNNIYLELLRYIKIVNLLLKDKPNTFTKDDLIKELNETMGKSYIDSKAFLRVFQENDFLDNTMLENNNEYSFLMDDITKLESFLKLEYEQDRCTILSIYELVVLRKIIAYIDLQEGIEKEKFVVVPKEAIDFQEDSNLATALETLTKRKILLTKDNGIFIAGITLVKYFRYYSVAQSFDHTIIYDC